MCLLKPRRLIDFVSALNSSLYITFVLLGQLASMDTKNLPALRIGKFNSAGR